MGFWGSRRAASKDEAGSIPESETAPASSPQAAKPNWQAAGMLLLGTTILLSAGAVFHHWRGLSSLNFLRWAQAGRIGIFPIPLLDDTAAFPDSKNQLEDKGNPLQIFDQIQAEARFDPKTRHDFALGAS